MKSPKPFSKTTAKRNSKEKSFDRSPASKPKRESKSSGNDLKMPRSFALKPTAGKGPGKSFSNDRPVKRTVTKTTKVFMFDEDNKPKRTRIKKEEITVRDSKPFKRSFDGDKKDGRPEKKSAPAKQTYKSSRSFSKNKESRARSNSEEKPSGRNYGLDNRAPGKRPAKKFNPEKKAEYDKIAKDKDKQRLSDFKDSKSFAKGPKTDFKSKKPQKKHKREDLEINTDGLLRLNKYIANSGLCSRREADTLIEQGLVSVNGKVVTEVGTKVKREDVIKYNGTRIKPEPFVYILLNKPKDYITTTEDDKGRKTVMELVADASSERLFPIGRLDRNTTGVLLLTNDGEVAQVLTHPRFQIKKIYHAVLDKKVTGDDLNKLLEGVHLDEDGMVRADAVAYVEKEDKRHIGIEIHSGKNRVVRRMFEKLGYDVEKLDRVAFGEFTKKNVERGRYRVLNDREIASLMKLKKKL